MTTAQVIGSVTTLLMTVLCLVGTMMSLLAMLWQPALALGLMALLFMYIVVRHDWPTTWKPLLKLK
jgi:hypothetical protein